MPQVANATGGPVASVRLGFPIAGIRAVAFHDRPGVWDLDLADGRVERIHPAASSAARWLLLPPLANFHAHANRSFAADGCRPRSLSEAVAHAKADVARATIADF